MSAIENKRDPYGPKTPAEEKYAKRVQLLEDAIALKEPERVPMVPMIGTVGYNLYGSSYKDALYNYDKAADAMFKFYEEFQPDAQTHNDFVSGRANELAGTKIIDWPGRPGTKLADRSIHQVIEHEFMEEDEYEEVSKDFTGFMLRKFIPRAYPNLKGLESVGIVPSVMLNTTPWADCTPRRPWKPTSCWPKSAGRT